MRMDVQVSMLREEEAVYESEELRAELVVARREAHALKEALAKATTRSDAVAAAAFELSVAARSRAPEMIVTSPTTSTYAPSVSSPHSR